MNHYDILGVKRTSSQEEIKKAYKNLVKKYHPDVYKGDKTFAEKKTVEINEAYDVLSNLELKQAYDEQIFPKVEYNYTPPQYTSSYEQYKNKYNTYSNYKYTQDGSEHDYSTYVNYGNPYTKYRNSNIPNYTNNSDDNFSDKIYNNLNKLNSKSQKLVFFIIIGIYLFLFLFSIIELHNIIKPSNSEKKDINVTNSSNQKDYDNTTSFENDNTSRNTIYYKEKENSKNTISSDKHHIIENTIPSEESSGIKNTTSSEYQNNIITDNSYVQNEITNSTVPNNSVEEYTLYDFLTEEQLQILYEEIKPSLNIEISYDQFKQVLAEYFGVSY